MRSLMSRALFCCYYLKLSIGRDTQAVKDYLMANFQEISKRYTISNNVFKQYKGVQLKFFKCITQYSRPFYKKELSFCTVRKDRKVLGDRSMDQYCSNRTNIENSGDNPKSLCQKMVQGPVSASKVLSISIKSFHRLLAKMRTVEMM